MFENIDNQIDTRLPKGDMSGLLIRECNWSVKTAGPSPYNNERTELFLLGCSRAMNGHPCKGCFNSSTWDNSKALWSHDPVKVAEHISNNAPNRYITIGGGEPTDQIENLIILCKELKEKYNFHIMMYTWRDLAFTLSKKFECVEAGQGKNFNFFIKRLLKYVDIIVDGEFKIEERLWDGSKEDGLISSVGSGNQTIWDINKKYGYYMRDIKELYLEEDDESNEKRLIYKLKPEAKERIL